MHEYPPFGSEWNPAAVMRTSNDGDSDGQRWVGGRAWIDSRSRPLKIYSALVRAVRVQDKRVMVAIAPMSPDGAMSLHGLGQSRFACNYVDSS